jgi:hypothetical protein
MSRARDIANLQSSKITADAGIDIDNINIDGTEIDLSSGDLTIDVAADIHLDAGGGDINFKVGGATFGFVAKYNDDLWIGSSISDGDLAIRGNDADGGNFTALSFDMSDQGTATFNHDVKMGDLCYLLLGAGNDLELVGDGTHGKIAAANGNLTLDVADEIILDADDGIWRFKDGGHSRLDLSIGSGSSPTFYSVVSDSDIVFKGNDGGSAVTALTLDMSDAGKALFNSGLSITSTDMPNVAAASIYHDSSNRLRFAGGTAGYLFCDDTNGTGQVSIDSSGNVGIGTTSQGDMNFGPLTVGSGSGTQGITIYSGTSNSGVLAFADGNSSSARYAGYIEYDHPNNNMNFYTVAGDLAIQLSGTNKNLIVSAGNVVMSNNSNQFIGVGTASSTVNSSSGRIIAVNDGNMAAINVAADNTGSRTGIVFTNPNNTVGSIVMDGSATAYNTSSDYRLKENIEYSWDATSRLKQLKPARFNFKTDADTTVDGFIAHEVSSIVPEAISGEKDGTENLSHVVLNANGTIKDTGISKSDWETGKANAEYTNDTTWVENKTIPNYQGIDQSKLVPLLVKTIQELEARIAKLEGS